MITLPVAAQIKTTVMLSEDKKNDLRSLFPSVLVVAVTYYKNV